MVAFRGRTKPFNNANETASFQNDKNETAKRQLKMSQDIKPFQTLEQLHLATADAFCELVTQRVAEQNQFCVSLSGGSTPKKLYEILATRDLPWQQMHWFWGDERNVPHEHQDSNFRMVCEALLNKVSVPESNVHGVSVNTDDPAKTAAEYEAVLRGVFRDDPFPKWDLALLGMGDDAHTASLFPETKALGETERWFVENWVEKFDAYRYTLTAPAINSATEKWFLVAGAAKQPALAKVLGDVADHNQYPSQLVTPTKWFVTQDAFASPT